jgi:pilus assembly protein Flp/PilA
MVGNPTGRVYNNGTQAHANFILYFQGDYPMLTFKDNRGQGLVEYALILVLVAVVVIVILALLGPAIGGVFSSILSTL